jgi:hypothetical protein
MAEMKPNQTAGAGPATMEQGLESNDLGRIAYQGAAAETKCEQPWSEASQAKWVAAAVAVANMQNAVLKRLYLASLGMVESEPDMASHEDVEAEFVAAMKEARAILLQAGLPVVELIDA